MSPVEQRLRRRIGLAGAIPFAELMEEALYGDGGYYRRRELAIGERGDFITGSSLSPLFARATLRLLRRLDEVLGAPAEMLEVGCGDGRHLGHLAAAAAGDGRRLRGCDRVRRPLPAGVEAVGELAEVAAGEVHGLVLAYELFDALPVHRLIGRPEGGLGEIWVALDEAGALVWRPGELSDPALAGLLGPDVRLVPGQVADLAPGWAPLYGELARRLGRGLLLTFDYGFERPALLDPRVRRHGTLACYRGHRVHRNPLVALGEQDLTAHVDFTTLRQAGEEAGLETFCLTRQALWLMACGLFDDLEGADAGTREAARQLLDPGGMGSEIRVLAQSRGIDAAAVVDLGLVAPARGPGRRLDSSGPSATMPNGPGWPVSKTKKTKE